MAANDTKVALIAGATSLVGLELVRYLLADKDWKLIYGVARKAPAGDIAKDVKQEAKFQFVSCNLLDESEAMAKLSPLADKVTHLFWLLRPSHPAMMQTPESGLHSRHMLSNALDALLVNGAALQHISLQTGTTHYVSLSAISVPNAVLCCDEDTPRAADGLAFDYYALEDVLMEKLDGNMRRIRSSVHRPGLLFGMSYKAPFNVVRALCVYGGICKHLGLPFMFMGSRQCWEEPYMDASDVRLVAHQLVWWTLQTDKVNDFEAFNAVNGIAFTWKEVWVPLAEKLGLATSNGDDEKSTMTEERSFTKFMGDKGKVWEEIVTKNGLRHTTIEELANWAFIDGLFRCPFKLLASPAKSQRMGFATVYSITDSMLYWVDCMRKEKLIP